MIEEMRAARGIALRYETVRRQAAKFGQAIARRMAPVQIRAVGRWYCEHAVTRAAMKIILEPGCPTRLKYFKRHEGEALARKTNVSHNQ